MQLCKKCGDTEECDHEWIELPDDYIAEVDHMQEHGIVASARGQQRIQEVRELLNQVYKYYLQSIALSAEGSFDDAAQVFGESSKRLKQLGSWSDRQSANFRVQHTLSWMRELDGGTDD